MNFSLLAGVPARPGCETAAVRLHHEDGPLPEGQGHATGRAEAGREADGAPRQVGPHLCKVCGQVRTYSDVACDSNFGITCMDAVQITFSLEAIIFSRTNA